MVKNPGDVRSRAYELQVTSYIPVIAEIGINHNGDMHLAQELIEIASLAGCDFVKFQKRDIEIVYSRDFLAGPRSSPWGETQRDQKIGLEFNESEYRHLQLFAAEMGIGFTASAWDLHSLDFVDALDPPFHKVASAMMTHESFLKAVGQTGRPIVASTGMLDEEALDLAVEILLASGSPLVLMHSVSNYPAALETLNLSSIGSLRSRYQLPVGYSGHEPSLSPSIAAMALGAVCIERHITKGRYLYGSDQSASLEPRGLRDLVAMARAMPSMIGDGVKRYAQGERGVAEKLRYWEVP